ncbi:DUF2085 domain-containing protein [Planomicrobium sp. Y74]|uniref:DUF2085 domain-containing protein n=1 Tax=Planomicrobium sp. Y74 TaxID=2478977 RepID=UPI000EF46FC8|nr:DUF2085 domain-containing protein [Planomicrobium sp. Y74]RLQ86658.1 DUF2085 domain-containing protein [Planomicrobium sp. Y74]
MGNILKLSFGCHQLAHRSYFYKGKQFPICARCTGISIGYLAGIIYAVIWGHLSMMVSLLLIVPLVIDGGWQYVKKRESTNNRRLVTGILAGIGTDFILYNIVVLGIAHGRAVVQHLIS